MATSGSTDHQVTAEQIIEDALFDCHALEEGESPAGHATSVALRRLNGILKRWQTIGDLRWKVEDAVLFLDVDKREYTLGTDHCAKGAWGYSTLSAAASASATSITVASTAASTPRVAATNGYNVGIELADGTRQWTTIKGTPTLTAIQLTAALTGAASSGGTVYWYQTRAGKPLRLLNPRRGRYNSNEVPVRVVSRQEYDNQPSKGSSGEPVMIQFDARLLTTRLKVWPVASDAKRVLWYSYEPVVDDVDTVGDNLDVPAEWQIALHKALAVELAPTYLVPMDRFQMLKMEAAEAYDQLLSWNADTSGYQMVGR